MSPHDKVFQENPDLHPTVLYEIVKGKNEKRMRDKCDQLFYYNTKNHHSPPRTSSQGKNQHQQPQASQEFDSHEETDEYFEIREAQPQVKSQQKHQPQSSPVVEQDTETLGLLAKIKQQSKLKQPNGNSSQPHHRQDSKSSNKSAKSGHFKEIFQHLYLSRDEFSTSQQA